MSYIKLCQVLYQGNPDEQEVPQTVFYQEDCMGEVLVESSLSYPVTFQCEVITFMDEASFQTKSNAEVFVSEQVTLTEAPVTSIRQEIYNQLIGKYPSLVI